MPARSAPDHEIRRTAAELIATLDQWQTPNTGPTAALRAACESALAMPVLEPLGFWAALRSRIVQLLSWLLGRRPAPSLPAATGAGATRIQTALAALMQEQSQQERTCLERVSQMQSTRHPDPEELRRALYAQLEGHVETGAGAVVTAGVEHVDHAIGAMRAEFTQRISACANRRELEGCIASFEQQAAPRVAAALEQTAELVAGRLHDVTAALEEWAKSEMAAQYRLTQQLGSAESPVASELTREDLEGAGAPTRPLQGAFEAFEKQRVGYGLKGVAAGAVLGTLIAPGIGTAVGAMVGVLAGWLKGHDALKQECVARVGACFDEARAYARAQLRSRTPELAGIIRATLDERLEDAFSRLKAAIAELLAVERASIDAERARLERVSAFQQALEPYQARLALAEDHRAG